VCKAFLFENAVFRTPALVCLRSQFYVLVWMSLLEIAQEAPIFMTWNYLRWVQRTWQDTLIFKRLVLVVGRYGFAHLFAMPHPYTSLYSYFSISMHFFEKWASSKIRSIGTCGNLAVLRYTGEPLNPAFVRDVSSIQCRSRADFRCLNGSNFRSHQIGFQ